MKSAIRLLAGACLAMACAGSALSGDLVSLPTRPGVTQGLYFDSASPHPPWVLVLFAGGDGNIGLTGSGPERPGNFVIKTASYWTDAGQACDRREKRIEQDRAHQTTRKGEPALESLECNLRIMQCANGC